MEKLWVVQQNLSVHSTVTAECGLQQQLERQAGT